MNALVSLVRRNPLLSFFVLVYALSWGLGAQFAGQALLAPDRLFCGRPSDRRAGDRDPRKKCPA